MKIAENEKFLIIDTENEKRPCSRVYVIIKNSNAIKTYDIGSLEFNLHNSFDDWEKRVAELCKESGII